MAKDIIVEEGPPVREKKKGKPVTISLHDFMQENNRRSTSHGRDFVGLYPPKKSYGEPFSDSDIMVNDFVFALDPLTQTHKRAQVIGKMFDGHCYKHGRADTKWVYQVVFENQQHHVLTESVYRATKIAL